MLRNFNFISIAKLTFLLVFALGSSQSLLAQSASVTQESPTVTENANSTLTTTSDSTSAEDTAQDASNQDINNESIAGGPNPESLEKIKDWTLGCDTDSQERCFIYQTIVNQENNLPILQAAVGRLPVRGQTGGIKPAILLTMPLGVILRSGVGITVDNNNPTVIPFEQCTKVGCSAILPLDNSLLNQFKRGLKAEVVIDEGQRLLVIELSLLGFTAGYNKLNL